MENRRTSMRLREPAAKLRENETKSEPAHASPKTRPVGRPKGTKKVKPTSKAHGADDELKVEVAEEQKIELAPKIINLPNKLVDGQSLPSLPTLQSRKLKVSEWQSVAESGVLVASLPRSRQRWLHEGMFETYWSKSTYKKKKEQMLQDAGKGPQGKEARPSMTKIGTCKMVVEPHIFDVTLFVIKHPAAATQHATYEKTSPYGHNDSTKQNSQQQQQQQHHHHMPSQPRPYTPGSSKPLYPAPQAGRMHNVVSQPAYGPPTTNANTAIIGMHSNQVFHHHGSRPINADAQNNPQRSSNASISVGPNAAAAPSQSATVKPTASAAGSTSSAEVPSPAPKAAPPTAAQNGAPDPVIQMLAQRAQNDHALKQVMKLVAGGQATQAQLNYFQGHIDELTKLVKERQEEEKRRKAQESKQQLKNNIPTSKHIQPSAAMQKSASSHNEPVAQRHPPQYQHQQQTHRPIYHQPAVPVQPRPPRQVHMPPPLHVLLEFSQNSADRFLFPKYSILEFDAQRKSVLASFLVVKTLSQIQQRQNQHGHGANGGEKVKRTYNKKPKVKDKDKEKDKDKGKADDGATSSTAVEVAINVVGAPDALATPAQNAQASQPPPQKAVAAQPPPPSSSQAATETTAPAPDIVEPGQTTESAATSDPPKATKSKAKGAPPKKAGAKKQQVANGQSDTAPSAAAEAATATSKPLSPPEKQYYQPVSVRFEAASDSAVFTALSRVVAPVAETQKYMMEVAAKAERVPVSYLAMRLPREPKEIIL